MNKILSKLKDGLPLAMLALALVLIFIPLPVMLIQTLIVLNIGFSLCLFLSKFFNSTAIAYYFPQLVLYSSVYTCGIAIATTRTFLSIPTLEGHIPLVLIIGQWICRENFVCGFFTTLMLCGSLLMFCKLYIQRVLEISARFCLDSMSKKLFDIDKQIKQKHITIEEGIEQKRKVQIESDYYSSMDGSAKFLSGTIVAFAVLFIVAVVGGTSIGILDLHMYWQDALYQYIMLSSGYLVLFVIPLFLTSLGFKTKKLE
jgi:flagellar biosynthesis component FlhA